MNPFDPVLDQPQSFDVDVLAENELYLLANHELRFFGTPLSNLRDLQWPGGGGLYARSIDLRLTAFHGDELTPMVSRYDAGFQETIFGSESLIVSKRLAVFLRSDDDRALLWSCECQAEADLVLRFDVEIDWGEALTQRLVDGLLVAQRNPGHRQGIYGQSNAESTRVFGNPLAHPDECRLDDESGRAHLVYHVLVNGIADVSLLLTLSNVGEQVAWNSFLALRDTERSFDLSNRAWEESLRRGRIWTPDPRLNRLIQQGKRATLQQVVHTRAGYLPASRRTAELPALVAGLDVLDARLSRNLLAHARRTLERTLETGDERAAPGSAAGALPLLLPQSLRERLAGPGRALVESNGAYLAALHAHLQRHPSAELAQEHWPAVQAAAEALVQARAWLLADADADAGDAQRLAVALAAAAALAQLAAASIAGAEADTVRWQSEAADLRRRFAAHAEGEQRAEASGSLPAWAPSEDTPWRMADPLPAIQLAADAVWLGCGVRPSPASLVVRPAWPATFGWWALTGLPLAQGTLSLVWDGSTLHTTQPLTAFAAAGAPLPVALHRTIRTLHSDETDFDLTFAFVDDAPALGAAPDSGTVATPAPASTFRPRFLKSVEPHASA